jgi:hypothetical protein
MFPKRRVSYLFGILDDRNSHKPSDSEHNILAGELEGKALPHRAGELNIGIYFR